MATAKSDCGICGSRDVVEVFDLGAIPIANAFVNNPGLPVERYPLRLGMCEKCFTVQVMDKIDPSVIFKDYTYLTSANPPMVDYFHAMAEELVHRLELQPTDIVLEIGGNDGTFLEQIKDRVRVCNVDPSEEACHLSKEKGIDTVCAFFDEHFARNYNLDGKVKCIVANNVMAHIPDLRGVLDGVRKLLTDDGTFVFEVQWLLEMLRKCAFDCIYHEHVYYHSLIALDRLVSSLGLSIRHVELHPVHGSSLRIYVQNIPVTKPAIGYLISQEAAMGIGTTKVFAPFRESVERMKETAQRICDMARSGGYEMAGYGAPAKATTLLNYFELTRRDITYTTDTTPTKQGKYIPGTRIPIYSRDAFDKFPPDYIFLFAWNYVDQILLKERELMKRGPRFVVPGIRYRIV